MLFKVNENAYDELRKFQRDDVTTVYITTVIDFQDNHTEDIIVDCPDAAVSQFEKDFNSSFGSRSYGRQGRKNAETMIERSYIAVYYFDKKYGIDEHNASDILYGDYDETGVIYDERGWQKDPDEALSADEILDR